MADDEKRLMEDTFVALVLILGELVQAAKRDKGVRTTASPATSALALISKERDGILSRQP